ncbi:hypothetical protein A2526_06865 [candidate division WOR-1 bacterium RIFOXYD2_FULL_36_8]|uniref:FCP1 homology domain-containing protein n=1 Tax=candidate division WOR-1 bacterium RIFOXYB2_FULL_36_35 TaxID=1802578 RepID=A0A1F4S5A5_UNCSA|nr:MAG: hypothetical protein A2230_00330 [candidate division WOR-1 bacterium RIFOXYA2_FULL_36_21]OGC15616.1 MAG: hypothetical protein A2290_06030 [candidate division WOR-1 bacterium RIFOXYB2_FULL_36_35]OGC16850.1 MAG: hypothetical protein A2282_08280 [candidate division WOR-1 bacterium RIFOXYA12_FULL_36_13]OGC37161.1 MAG: hypothetical protein A2526_06865 [candidate division WOR-1 bacterium RIFOXYD2_FULL_36_8]
MKTIAWDVDDVLNDLMRVWFEKKWKVDHPECKLSYKDIRENPPYKLLGATLEEYQNSLDEFRGSHLFAEMLPVKESMNWLKENGSNFRHIALTAVPLACASVSAGWVFKYFGEWIRTFHFVPSKRKDKRHLRYDDNKGDFLKWIKKVDIIVEDNLENIRLAKEVGVKTVVIPRPWNSEKKSIKEVLFSIL